MSDQKKAIAAILESLALTVEVKFIPFSQSRNKDEKNPSLNWSVTLKRHDASVMTFDYSAGCAHCPSYHVKVSPHWDRPDRMWRDEICRFECENGFKARGFTSWGGFSADRSRPILPDSVNVIYSLVMDSSVLDSGGFEQWADEFGYDQDSRKAESIYRACLEIALKLRGAIGDSGMQTLRNAYQDY